jgi:hypothetical protein
MLAAIRFVVESDRPQDWEAVERAGLNSAWAKQTPPRAARVMKQLRTGVFA